MMAQAEEDRGYQVYIAAKEGRWDDVVQTLTTYAENQKQILPIYEVRVLEQALQQHAKHKIITVIDRGFTFRSGMAKCLLSNIQKCHFIPSLTSKPSPPPGPAATGFRTYPCRDKTDSDKLFTASVASGPAEADLHKLSSCSLTPGKLQKETDCPKASGAQKPKTVPITVLYSDTPGASGPKSKRDKSKCRELKSSLDVLSAAWHGEWASVFRALTGIKPTTDAAGSERQETSPQGETDDAAETSPQGETDDAAGSERQETSPQGETDDAVTDREVESINYGIKLTRMQQEIVLDYVTQQGCGDQIIKLAHGGYLFPVGLLEKMVRSSLHSGKYRFVGEMMLCTEYQFPLNCLTEVLDHPRMYGEEETLFLVMKIAQQQDSKFFNTSVFVRAFRKMVSAAIGPSRRREKWEGLFLIAVENKELMDIMDNNLSLTKEDEECINSVRKSYLAEESAQKVDQPFPRPIRGRQES